MIYHFERRGRSGRAVVGLCLIYAGFAAIWVGLDAAWWIIAALAMFTLPALWDIIRDARSSVSIYANRLVWVGAFSNGEARDIDHIRMNRRFDGTFKILLVHVGGATTRLPPDIAPPIDPFEDALKQAGIAAQRHPFSPF